MTRRHIWWIRRDLRLSDNPALLAAADRADEVIPVFILDPALLASEYMSEKRLWFLFEGLRLLDEDLRALGSRLVVREGPPVPVLEGLVDETGAEAVFAQEDYSPYARRRDAVAAGALPLTLTSGVAVVRPGDVLKDDGKPYTVYTPFSKQWKAVHKGQAPRSRPERLRTPAHLPSDGLPRPPEISPELPFEPGEQEGIKILRAFTEGSSPPVFAYSQERNRMDLDGTSRLSPYLRFGMVSPRTAVQAALKAGSSAPDKAARKGAETWLNELIWREFFIHILYHFPHVRGTSFRESYQDIEWANDEEDFRAWCLGKTGFPVVDAAMRQLQQTGWMHNRARMVTASFLTKELLIDWRWGERWFMQHLIDGDPASNNGGWQWVAGTGTDAAPYFRIFNPILQSKKFDPDGTYIRRWVPELKKVPGDLIHEPWKMKPEEQQAAACVMGRDYPERIVDRTFARERTLAAFKVARET